MSTSPLLAEPPTDEPPPARPAERAAPNPKAPFNMQLATRLGRKLTGVEAIAAREVDRIFRERHDGAPVPALSLEFITADDAHGAETAPPVRLWPTPPANPWEAWLYIAAHFRRGGRAINRSLLEVTDWAEVDALVGDWERAERVEHWRDWLEKSAQSAVAAKEPRELRVRLTEEGAQLEWRKNPVMEFKPLAGSAFAQFAAETSAGRAPFDGPSRAVWEAFHTGYGSEPFRRYSEPDSARILNNLLRRAESSPSVVGPAGERLLREAEPLVWRIEDASDTDYTFALLREDGQLPPPPLVVLDGEPSLYITDEAIFSGPPLGGLEPAGASLLLPREALESSAGLALLERLKVPPPGALAGRMRSVKLRPLFNCAVTKDQWGDGEHLVVQALAEAGGERVELFAKTGWRSLGADVATRRGDEILRLDRTALTLVPELLEALRLQWWPHENHWHKTLAKKFPEQFAAWLSALPEDATIELDPLLASFRDSPVRATVRLEIGESEIDWFDLRVALDVADTSLTKAEIKLLLDARGGFVRLGSKGWRRLAFEMSPEDEAQLADLGLDARDFSSKPQRLHALQLAGKSAARRMLGEKHAALIERRAAELHTRVAPPLPDGLHVELRPYQLAGYHFLAYLTANRFGGILADDMGLGKTVQTLAWLLWLRAEQTPISPKGSLPSSLVVCPKSVTDNWLAEATRFAPGMRVVVLGRGGNERALSEARAAADLVVINYTQLRLLEKALIATPWLAVILDEAQSIKNADSQTAKAAWALPSPHRLALSGTPIENRLLDLWSIMNFVMPGILGPRAAFARTYDQRSDPFARRRLTARVRPFVLRRTKNEVAKDLPERVEEDLLCEMEGEQLALYRAELKRARAALLKIGNARDLDAARFHILTSLLRLRQICCHPSLAAPKAAPAESSKLAALMDLLEPLLEEGHKVLVFSQFVEMLNLLQAEMTRRDWPYFLLTGQTEDRGPLIAEFQAKKGSAVFLISLRAGGFGLNLTAASYVVLYDPWWNPAVENQAIDRTHRIGQTNKVIAYRLLVKNSIEEKIRALQKQKRALAEDILGEETFARALTLDDFQFLLAE